MKRSSVQPTAWCLNRKFPSLCLPAVVGSIHMAFVKKQDPAFGFVLMLVSTTVTYWDSDARFQLCKRCWSSCEYRDPFVSPQDSWVLRRNCHVYNPFLPMVLEDRHEKRDFNNEQWAIRKTHEDRRSEPAPTLFSELFSGTRNGWGPDLCGLGLFQWTCWRLAQYFGTPSYSPQHLMLAFLVRRIEAGRLGRIWTVVIIQTV